MQTQQVTSRAAARRASAPVAASISTHRAFYSGEYEPLRSVRPDPDQRPPNYYPRERTFNVGRLIGVSAAMLAGWGVGHLPVQIACGVIVTLVGVLMVGNRWRT